MFYPSVKLSTNITLARYDAVGRGNHAINEAGIDT